MSWEDTDNGCPPVAPKAEENIKEKAPEKVWSDKLAPNNPPAADEAWENIDNPGNKGDAGLK